MNDRAVCDQVAVHLRGSLRTCVPRSGFQRAPMTVGLDFDAETHTYRLDGVVVPSVTQVLQLAGVTPTYWYDTALRDSAGELGTMVHLACEYLDQGVLDWKTLAPQLVPFVRAYEAFRHDTGFTPSLIEARFAGHLETFAMAGTLDRAGCNPWIVLDLKSGTVVKWTMGVQLAGYVVGMKQALSTMVVSRQWLPSVYLVRRLVVQLRPHGTKPYRLYEYDDPADFETFRAALVVAHAKLRAGVPLGPGLEEPESQ